MEFGKATLRARDVMTKDIVRVAEDSTMRDLIETLQENDISGVPVVNARGKITGVVTLSDIAAASVKRAAIAPERAHPDFYVHEWEEKLNPDDLRQLHVEDDSLLVRDIMTRRVLTVPADAPIAEVARTMVEGHFHRLLVADREKLVGIVSTLDVLRSIADPGALTPGANSRPARRARPPVASRHRSARSSLC
jgi:CBS domain-containing protein